LQRVGAASLREGTVALRHYFALLYFRGSNS